MPPTDPSMKKLVSVDIADKVGRATYMMTITTSFDTGLMAPTKE